VAEAVDVEVLVTVVRLRWVAAGGKRYLWWRR
jgi:hypothetical protein